MRQRILEEHGKLRESNKTLSAQLLRGKLLANQHEHALQHAVTSQEQEMRERHANEYLELKKRHEDAKNRLHENELTLIRKATDLATENNRLKAAQWQETSSSHTAIEVQDLEERKRQVIMIN